MRCNHRFPGVFRVQDIQADEEGMVIADHWGIWRIADGEASLLSKLPAPGANAIVIDPVSGQWIACGKSGLTLIKGVDQQIIREFRRPIQSVYVDSDARLWVGTYGLGLYRWDQNVWRVYHDEGVDQIDPNCIAPTADGGVVVGTSDGFWWSSDGDTLEELDLGLQPEHRNITAVCVSGLRVWIGGRGGWAAQVVEGGYERLPIPEEASAFRISGLCHDVRTDCVWYVSSPGRGIGVIAPDGQVIHYGPRNEWGVPLWVGAIVFCLSDHRIRGGTQEGIGSDAVFEFIDGRFQLLCGSLDLTVNAIAEHKGEVFLGTSNGVFRLHREGVWPLCAGQALPCGIVTCLHFDSSGTMWIGTEGGGVGRYDGNLLLRMEIPGGPRSYCQKLWIGRSGNQGLDGRKEESVSSG